VFAEYLQVGHGVHSQWLLNGGENLTGEFTLKGVPG
jgi:hypothetical protein